MRKPAFKIFLSSKTAKILLTAKYVPAMPKAKTLRSIAVMGINEIQTAFGSGKK